jgi:hypothetical protein
MGGWNSGRRGGKPTVEGCTSIVLSINAILRATGGRSPSGLRLEATINGQRQEILLRLDLDPEAGTGTLALKYDVQHVSTATGPQHYSVPLVSTPCRFGGRRWWVICPATGRRVVNLCLPNGGRRFLSRAAYRLPYQSQRETVTGRAWRTIRKLERRLGNAPGTPPDAMEKPKWMRWRTFDALRTKREAAEDALDADLLRCLERLARYLPA